jgi:ABC-type antimicrobial peptide transport system permease subunit
VTNLRLAVGASGGVSIVTRTYDPIGTAIPIVLTSGTAPIRDGDVVLAPATAHQLHAHVGSTVALSGDRAARSLRVSGIGFGVQTSTSFYDSGAWVSRDAYDQLFHGFQEHGGMIALRAGSRLSETLPRIQRAAGAAARRQDVLVITPFVPAQLAQIRDIRTLPGVLGYLLMGLAVAGVGQTLAAAVRSRTGEIAVLRALGMTPRQSRGLIGTQALVFGAFALLVGIPLGLALGRTLWRATAEIMPLQYRPPIPSTALLLIGPAVLATVLLLAVLPARRAARLRVADALRAE